MLCMLMLVKWYVGALQSLIIKKEKKGGGMKEKRRFLI